MDKIALRQQVIEAAKAKLTENLGEYHERISELKAVTIENDLAETASQREGRRDADIELMNTLGEKLEHVQRDLASIGQLSVEDIHDEVEYGAIVITDHRAFLVALGIEEFQVNDLDVLGLSVKAPLYQELKGKTAGEKATVNNVTYTIKDIL